MRPAARRDFLAFAIMLLFIAVAGITVAVLSFQRMSDALAYADRTGTELAASRAEAKELKYKVSDLQTLQTLSAKSVAPSILVPDSSWLSYSSPNLSLQYPPGFSVKKATASFPALTIESGAGKIEIFRLKDFDGERSVGMGENSLPKGSMMVGTELQDSRIQPYDAWLYYRADDAATKSALEAIAASVKALR